LNWERKVATYLDTLNTENKHQNKTHRAVTSNSSIGSLRVFLFMKTILVFNSSAALTHVLTFQHHALYIKCS